MTALLTWLGGLLSGILVPIIEKLISQMQISKTVSDVQTQQNALIKAVSTLQTAKTPEDFQNDILKVAQADNSD